MNPYRKSRTAHLPHDPCVEAQAAQYEALARTASYNARKAKDKNAARSYAADASRYQGLANRLRVSP